MSIFIVSGLLLGGCINRYLKNILKQHTVKLQLFWLIFSAGSIITALFFLLNNVFSKNEVYSIRALIVETYITRTKSGRESVNAEVKLAGFTKDLLFSIEEEEKVFTSNFVLLKVSKGGLGFERIKNRTLVKN